jgi:hypothetical protein
MKTTKTKPSLKSKVKPKRRKFVGSADIVVVKKEEQNLPVKEVAHHLNLANPHDVMSFGKVLRSFIVDNHLSVKIGDTDYSMVDGWKFAGLNFGLTAIPSMPVAEHKPGEYICILYAKRTFQGKKGDYTKEVPVFVGFLHDKDIIDEIRIREKPTRELVKPYFAYKCDCEIVKISDTGVKVTRGTGFCSNLEALKLGFDEYSVISMCETRSIGKGYRNLLGHVMKASGMEPTPAEEMNKDMGADHGEAAVVNDHRLPLTEAQMKVAFPKVMAGEMTVADIEVGSILDESQKKSLEKAEESFKAKHK